MKKKVIQLPKGYLSYSQISLWMSSPERYKKIYFNADDSYRFTNTGMDFGKVVADALEREEQTNDLLTDIAIDLLPKYDVRDKEIVTTLKTKDGAITVVGKPDSLDSVTKNFYEFKTGKVKWTQEKVNKSLQLKIYATVIYLEYGVLLDRAELVWMETFNDSDGKIQPTGNIERFILPITKKDIMHTMSLISRVAKEIESEWVLYTPPPEIPF